MSIRVYDGRRADELSTFADGIVAGLASPEENEEENEGLVPGVEIEPLQDLLGIDQSVYDEVNSAFKTGKRHIILYGPPGTGKTTLAEHIAGGVSPSGAYVLLTASSAWSSQDLIGGYQPMGGGEIAFIPGTLLQNFDRPLIIDELNRCPIDKVLGPLFSVLSGQRSTLPYRVDVKDPKSRFYSVVPSSKLKTADDEFTPTGSWRLIGTLNTVDKSSLGQISYALARRFAWIKVPIPEDLDNFIHTLLQAEHLPFRSGGVGYALTEVWKAINLTREIGGAPIIDFIRTAKVRKIDFDFASSPPIDDLTREIYLSCIRMFFLPLLDGIQQQEAEMLLNVLRDCLALTVDQSKSLSSDLDDIAL